MTLIVGYADNDIGFLVGDTLLSYPIEQYNPREPLIEKFHALKIQILTPDIAVAFAGDVDTSLAIIRHLHKELSIDSQLCVPQRILYLHRELANRELAKGSALFQHNCEFLVLLITPEKTKKLAQIKEDQIDYVQRAYIGDATEHANFRGFMRPYAGPETRHIQNPDGSWNNLTHPATDGEIEFDQVSDALEKLTHQRRSETVGAICGCVTRVVDARISGKLEYMQSVEASVSPAEGHGGFSLLASNVGPVRGIGLYYRGWHAGLIFIVSDPIACRKEDASTIGSFIEVARAKYGLHLEGGTW
jgi:hypothetical protein